MRIQQITLHNMRLVEEMSIRFDASKNVTIVLGENGKGKTTLLDAIALSANVFTSAFPLQKRRNPSPWDIRIGEGNKAEGLPKHSSCFFDEWNRYKDRTLFAERCFGKSFPRLW